MEILGCCNHPLLAVGDRTRWVQRHWDIWALIMIMSAGMFCASWGTIFGNKMSGLAALFYGPDKSMLQHVVAIANDSRPLFEPRCQRFSVTEVVLKCFVHVRCRLVNLIGHA